MTPDLQWSKEYQALGIEMLNKEMEEILGISFGIAFNIHGVDVQIWFN